MTRPPRLLAVSLALVAGCATAGRSPRPAGAEPCAPYPVVRVGQGEGVLFPAGAGYVEGRSPKTVTEYWTPTAEDALAAESGIAECLRTEAPALAAKFSSYRRQYTGFLSGGRKLLFVQFLCETTGPDWRCHPIVVDDGGDCFFHLEYDVSSGACRKLWVNEP